MLAPRVEKARRLRGPPPLPGRWQIGNIVRKRGHLGTIDSYKRTSNPFRSKPLRVKGGKWIPFRPYLALPLSPPFLLRKILSQDPTSEIHPSWAGFHGALKSTRSQASQAWLCSSPFSTSVSPLILRPLTLNHVYPSIWIIELSNLLLDANLDNLVHPSDGPNSNCTRIQPPKLQPTL